MQFFTFESLRAVLTLGGQTRDRFFHRQIPTETVLRAARRTLYLLFFFALLHGLHGLETTFAKNVTFRALKDLTIGQILTDGTLRKESDGF